jgi:hypothetical protein
MQLRGLHPFHKRYSGHLLFQYSPLLQPLLTLTTLIYIWHQNSKIIGEISLNKGEHGEGIIMIGARERVYSEQKFDKINVHDDYYDTQRTK